MAELNGSQLPQIVSSLWDLRERQGEEAVDTREGERGKVYWDDDLILSPGREDPSPWEDGEQTESSCRCSHATHEEHTLAPGSLHSDAHTLKMKLGWQVETAWEPRGGAGGSLGMTSAVGAEETWPETPVAQEPPCFQCLQEQIALRLLSPETGSCCSPK